MRHLNTALQPRTLPYKRLEVAGDGSAPQLTDSGFTALLAGERLLWHAMDRVIRERISGGRTSLPAMLKLQRPKMEMIIRVISQQFERLRIPGFATLAGRPMQSNCQPSSELLPIDLASGPLLVAMHGGMIALMETLVVQKRGGLRGRIIIRELCRWHATMVTELLELPVVGRVGLISK